jgi:hypothetical protein
MSEDRTSRKLHEEIVSLRSRLVQLEREIRATSEKADEQTTSMLIEQEELRREVVGIEQRMARIEERTREIVANLKKVQAWQDDKGERAEDEDEDEDEDRDVVSRDSIVIDKLKGLQDRVKHMEVEKSGLMQLCEELRTQNEAISNLYVAKHRLHATFKPDEVMTIIQEILVELIGAKQFGILMLDQKKKVLRLVAGHGVEDRLRGKTLPAGEGIIGDVATTGKPFFFEHTKSTGDRSHLPLATIPLKMRDATMGVVVIYHLLDHKKSLSPIDHQLLDLVAEHAPNALLSAHLFSSRSSKRSASTAVFED